MGWCMTRAGDHIYLIACELEHLATVLDKTIHFDFGHCIHAFQGSCLVMGLMHILMVVLSRSHYGANTMFSRICSHNF